MPSKALIQVANEYHRRGRWRGPGIRGGQEPVPNIHDALAYVRKLRDGFAGEVARSTKWLGGRLVRGRALMLGPNALRVGRTEFFARRVILATGSRPVVPKEYLDLGSRVVTSDSLFEAEDLPHRIGVVGIGSIGLELGQALSRLGCDIVAFDRSGGVGELSDPKINSYAFHQFSKEFQIHLNTEATLKAHSGKIAIMARGRTCERDLILASLGRRPNLDRLGLETTGAVLDERGVPSFDPRTMQLAGLPMFHRRRRRRAPIGSSSMRLPMEEKSPATTASIRGLDASSGEPLSPSPSATRTSPSSEKDSMNWSAGATSRAKRISRRRDERSSPERTTDCSTSTSARTTAVFSAPK